MELTCGVDLLLACSVVWTHNDCRFHTEPRLFSIIVLHSFFLSCLIVIIKTKERHYFSNLFWYRIIHVSDGYTLHHQESSTVYTTIGNYHTGYVDYLMAGSGWNSA